MDFDQFLADAWNEHGDRPQEVADRLTHSMHVVRTPDQVPRFAALAAHVFGEHLGQWDAGLELLATLGSAASSSPPARAALERQRATLRYAKGEADAFAALTADDHTAALANAVGMLGGRGDWGSALAAFDAVMQRARAPMPPESAANRALAAMGNNLAAALEDKPDRNAEQTRSMLAAAQAGLKYWCIAGTWLEEERAHYRLARSCLQAGDATAALRSARDCLAVCEANGAPPFERFFSHAVLAVAQRAADDAAGFEASRECAIACAKQLTSDEQGWCEADLAALRG